jgi:hypothetical protein
VPVLATNYKQNITLPAEVKKFCYSLCQICLFECIPVKGSVGFMKLLRVGRAKAIKDLETLG